MTYTAVYDTGVVVQGAVAPDSSGDPLTVEFTNVIGDTTLALAPHARAHRPHAG